VSSLRDSMAVLLLPGTYVPGYSMPPLRGWKLARFEVRVSACLVLLCTFGVGFHRTGRAVLSS